MKNYRNLNVWKKAHELVLLIYRLTGAFPKAEQYNLTGQIRRAAISIPSNLAEGCGKFSQADLARYVQISLGSTHEVEYQAFLALELGYLKDADFKKLDLQINEVKAMLIRLVSKIRKDASSLKP